MPQVLSESKEEGDEGKGKKGGEGKEEIVRERRRDR
jgi:hypothetical protein